MQHTKFTFAKCLQYPRRSGTWHPPWRVAPWLCWHKRLESSQSCKWCCAPHRNPASLVFHWFHRLGSQIQVADLWVTFSSQTNQAIRYLEDVNTTQGMNLVPPLSGAICMFLASSTLYFPNGKCTQSLPWTAIQQPWQYLFNVTRRKFYIQVKISDIEGAIICTRSADGYISLPVVSKTGITSSGFSGMPTRHIFPFVFSTLRNGSSECWADTVLMMKSIDFAAACAHNAKMNQDSHTTKFTIEFLKKFRTFYNRLDKTIQRNPKK